MSTDKVTSVETFLRKVWDFKEPAHVHLYRGQHEAKPLLPKLFRPPGDAKTVEETEGKLLYRFKNRSPYLLPTKADNNWDWLSLGQHFGLPTRLLDWTGNPKRSPASHPQRPILCARCRRSPKSDGLSLPWERESDCRRGWQEKISI
jgi:FRG domain